MFEFSVYYLRKSFIQMNFQLLIIRLLIQKEKIKLHEIVSRWLTNKLSFAICMLSEYYNVLLMLLYSIHTRYSSLWESITHVFNSSDYRDDLNWTFSCVKRVLFWCKWKISESGIIINNPDSTLMRSFWGPP